VWTASMMQREAEAECERCRGRICGDCDPACRYWRYTASDKERGEAANNDGDVKLRGVRLWGGPRFPNWRVEEE